MSQDNETEDQRPLISQTGLTKTEAYLAYLPTYRPRYEINYREQLRALRVEQG